MTEPGVAITDYAVSLEALFFLVMLARRECRRPDMRSWMVVFFASIGAASFCGGTYHGFFVDGQTFAQTAFWSTTLIAMGLTALSLWAIGAKLLFSKSLVRWIVVAASVQFVVSSALVVRGSATFRFAALNDLPGIVFLCAALMIAYARERDAKLLLAASAMVLTMVGFGLQQLHVEVQPLYFNHNALYHVFQAIALALFFCGTGSIIGDNRSRGERRQPT